MGLPFLVFMVVGTWMWAKVLQPKMDRQTGSAAASRDRPIPADPAQAGVARAVDPNKKKSNMHTSGAAPPAVTAKRRMTTLEEEYEKAQAVWQDDYENKRVPRTPEQEAKRTH